MQRWNVYAVNYQSIGSLHLSLGLGLLVDRLLCRHRLATLLVRALHVYQLNIGLAVVKPKMRWSGHGTSKKIPNNIVDEHSLLLYIKFCAERPKQDRKGNDIPGTFVGASQLKKLFFGALRIRKEQDANLLTLARTRPATSVIFYDSIKTRMDEALTLVTSLVWGHLAWTAQHASGNRGDDFRALKLAELQPTVLKHPDKLTDIWAVLGMQSEQKAGKRAMRTVAFYVSLARARCLPLQGHNPVYSTFIANAKPEMCPLGGFALYFH
ncbi:hypothetical protein B0H16DRAFT_1737605 [Mycena metata]|uniref:Uncharacterized protein n=1 Tax=Mycena metata TaxID=1033252 RepID=A0AAD7MLG4_9AGAR|nr:hypothetical protein B0H16DRAFT_1737605 [Mycena metata]